MARNSRQTVNRVVLIGEVVSDMDFRSTTRGLEVRFEFRTTDSWRDKHTGVLREQHQIHRVRLNERLALNADKLVWPAAVLYLEGRLVAGEIYIGRPERAVKVREVLVEVCQAISDRPSSQHERSAGDFGDPMSADDWDDYLNGIPF